MAAHFDSVVKNLDLVLLGKTGNGKSATGNSILWRRAFKATADHKSVTQEVKSEYAKHREYSIKVVDTPGLADTGLSEIQDKERTVMSMSEVFRHCNKGVHVFLLVVRLDVRMTKEERDVFMTLRNIFGDRYLKDHGIVAVTHGDAFERKMDEEELDMSFEEWIRQPDLGPIGELFAECEYRCVLFDNKTKVFEIKDQQLKTMLTFAEQLRQKGIYPNEHFQKFESERKKLIMELKLPHLKDSIQNKIDLLMSCLSGLTERSAIEEVKKMEEKVSMLLEEIRHEDEGTFLLQDVQTQVENIGKKCQRLKDLIRNHKLEEAKKMVCEGTSIQSSGGGGNTNSECNCL